MNNNYDILVVGTGGLALQCLPLLKEKYTNIAFYDDINLDKKFFTEYDCPIFHNIEINRIIYPYIIAISDPKFRRKIYDKFNHSSENLIDKKHELSKLDRFGKKGMIILQDCLIEQNVEIDSNTLINTKCSIHHGCQIHEFVTLAPNVTLLGDVEVGENTFIGAGTIVKEKIKIGKNCLIGQMSNVTKDISDNSVAYGNPCKVIRKNK